jgi:streptogramin lyase
MTTRNSLLPSIALGVLMAPLLAPAATVEGTVTGGDGAALAGVMVTVTRADSLYAETVYSNAKGAYRLETGQQGQVGVRARKPGFADLTVQAELGADAAHKQDFKLKRLTDKVAIAESLPASAYYTRIKFNDERERKFFAIECLTCHQLGNAYTRAPRTQQEWTRIMTRMLGFWNVKDEPWIKRYVGILSRAFDGTIVTTAQKHAVDPMIFPARIVEWKIPQGVIAHDVEYHVADGKFYTVDQGNDQIYITDPVANLTETFKIPDGGIPVGGKFLAMYNDPAPFSLVVSRGPHSLQEGPDHKYYTTDTVSGQIGVFDPATRAFEGHDIGGNAMYPHTLRFDQKGHVWFTLGVSNQVGRFDPVEKKMTVLDLPATSERPHMPALMPYGIDVHPQDGGVWYTRLMANRIGRIDPETLEVKEFEPPLVGPRRMRFAKDGTLWIPSFGDGSLVRLDTATMEYEHYPIPPLSPAEIEAPYAVGVHPQTQEVWVTANMSDRMFRFLPGEKRFVAYQLPTRGIYLRDVVFTPEGWVCAASSPAPAPLVVEGGMQEVMCIDPG